MGFCSHYPECGCGTQSGPHSCEHPEELEDQAAVVRRLSKEPTTEWAKGFDYAVAEKDAEIARLTVELERSRLLVQATRKDWCADIARLTALNRKLAGDLDIVAICESEERLEAEIARLKAIPTKLRNRSFSVARTDMVGDDERWEGYAKALKEVEKEMIGERQHKWFKVPNLRGECCEVCGVLRRAEGMNNPCNGPLNVGQREEREQEAEVERVAVAIWHAMVTVLAGPTTEDMKKQFEKEDTLIRNHYREVARRAIAALRERA